MHVMTDTVATSTGGGAFSVRWTVFYSSSSSVHTRNSGGDDANTFGGSGARGWRSSWNRGGRANGCR